MVTKFKDYEYKRPDLDVLTEAVNKVLKAFDKSESVEDEKQAIFDYNALMNKFYNMSTLASIRASIDTNDKFYDEERNFYDEFSPNVSELDNKFKKRLAGSKFRDQLEKEFGSQLFALTDNALKEFDPSIMELMKEENRLTTEYSKLLASAQIDFDGKTLSLTEFGKYMIDSDREVRKNATLAVQGFMGENLDKIDTIYDNLVKVRDKMAKTLGLKDFVELGYIRMNRIGYDRDMVENFRKQIEAHVVPIVSDLKRRQKERIGVDSLKSYDSAFEFNNGNPIPKGSTKEIMEKGAKMYKELSPETDEFYTYMIERDLFDVEAKKGKEGGGYCTYINDYKSPFIFSNFNGTQGDVEVLTHEAGHAFQVYSSRDVVVPEYIWPTMEAAEIHSMSMEFFTYPWMELFFEEDTDKFKFSHVSGALEFLPYGVAIDEFQHVVYENPELTPEERRNEWKKIEEKYLPETDYDGIEPLIHGSLWHRQGHVFAAPFYYIDYTLAQVVALQFWKRANEDFEGAWKDYLTICKLGGSLPFGEIVKSANLLSPFEDGTLESTIAHVKDFLNTIDDKNL
ncbi:M3 family oligoendopeptidase [Phocicoccus pinnipedialis]|uniref:Peptidase family M3 n=1 Tax=Phocicoccus pinnipedialis TaxID=110845 RepID=A0A6V7R896_9BACL|nr:M3 family oligoendopeptidase [Jeotgalicoccus pinnipedialis]MBP1940138.1 M3 family oligoendopeptidase [Jeotgalicoccus pinnipedialis]CAD2073707.1 Peptidase family M3 [Jeotgalicoccus pinnipedialis]